MFDFKGQKLLIIAPHPDDEVIGCAGLIQKVKKSGGKVYVLFLTVGDTKDFTKNGSSSLKERKDEIKKVSTFLKYDDYDIAFEGKDYHLKLDKIGQKELMDVIERESKVSLEKIKPDIVAFPSVVSYNQDHRVAAYAAHAACRPASPLDKHFISTVLSYEEPADSWNISTPSIVSFFITLTKKELEKKIKAMELYGSQNRPFPNLRSLKSLDLTASIRGARIGFDYAEGFGVYRLVS